MYPLSQESGSGDLKMDLTWSAAEIALLPRPLASLDVTHIDLPVVALLSTTPGRHLDFIPAPKHLQLSDTIAGAPRIPSVPGKQ